MQDLHAHANLRVIKCRLCSEERIFDGHTIDEIEPWKDRHYKDGRPVCVGAYPAHVRDALVPILRAGQEETPDNDRPRYPLYVDIENRRLVSPDGEPILSDEPEAEFNGAFIRAMDHNETLRAALREVAQAYHVPERLVRPDYPQTRIDVVSSGSASVRNMAAQYIAMDETDTWPTHQYVGITIDGEPIASPNDTDILAVDIRQYEDPANRSNVLVFEFTLRDGRIKFCKMPMADTLIYVENANVIWEEICRDFKGLNGFDIDALAQFTGAAKFLRTYRASLCGL